MSGRLVLYFSVYGTAKRVAEEIAFQTGADLLAIEPAVPYGKDRSHYIDLARRAQREHDQQLRPMILNPRSVAPYDEIFLGYPIWWGIAAWPVNQFVTGNDFTGKAVIPFCTSASSGLGQSGTLLAEAAGTGEWLEGARFSYGTEEADVQAWISGLTESIAQAIEQAQTVTKD